MSARLALLSSRRLSSAYGMGIPGEIRSGPVRITHSQHAPPQADALPRLLGGLFEDLHAGWSVRDPCTSAAIALWRIGWIHPFPDGNGRTARLFAMRLLLAGRGEPPERAGAMARSIRGAPQDYYRALHAADARFEQTGDAELSCAHIAGWLRHGNLTQALVHPDTKALAGNGASR